MQETGELPFKPTAKKFLFRPTPEMGVMTMQDVGLHVRATRADLFVSEQISVDYLHGPKKQVFFVDITTPEA